MLVNTKTRTAPMEAAVTMDRRARPVPRPISAASTATTANQTIGGVPPADRTVNNATPVIDPEMSIV